MTDLPLVTFRWMLLLAVYASLTDADVDPAVMLKQAFVDLADNNLGVKVYQASECWIIFYPLGTSTIYNDVTTLAMCLSFIIIFICHSPLPHSLLFIVCPTLYTALLNKHAFVMLAFCSTLNPPQTHLFLMLTSFHIISYFSFSPHIFSCGIVIATAMPLQK
jgi:hypothetical protein